MARSTPHRPYLPPLFAAAKFPPPSSAATKSLDPDPQREIVLIACVNGI
jgi:hypothetical protein